jgi:methanogenic corrinoid protein MtbC1
MALFDRLHTEPVYNTRAVVQRTGVPADTFRAWERRYNFPSPCRTLGNQRLYSERDVAIICWLRDQTKAGMTISHAVSLYRALTHDSGADGALSAHNVQPQNGQVKPVSPAITELATGSAGSVHVPQQGPTLPQEPRQSYFHACLDLITALSRYDTRNAERILDELTAMSSAETVCQEVLQPALIEIGRRWESGQLTTSAEHFASAFVQRKVNALYNVSRPDVGKGPIVAACVEGEEHELGLLFTSLFLSRSGYQIIYLGSNLPAVDLVSAVQSLRPPLVLLSATTHETIPAMERTIRLLRDTIEPPLPDGSGQLVGYGGGVFNRQPELRRRIDAIFLGCDGFQAVQACDRLLAGVPAHS